MFLTTKNHENELQKIIIVLLKQAQARGELKLESLAPRIVELPLLLLVNKIVLQKTLSHTAVTQIVEQILLPLFLKNSR